MLKLTLLLVVVTAGALYFETSAKIEMLPGGEGRPAQ
jgi:hypothetical protein